MNTTSAARRLVIRRLNLLFWCCFILWTIFWLIAPVKYAPSAFDGGLVLRLGCAAITLLGPLAFALVTALQGAPVMAVIGQLLWTIAFAVPFAGVIQHPELRAWRIIAMLAILAWLLLGAGAAGSLPAIVEAYSVA
jgi:hypothetical protein